MSNGQADGSEGFRVTELWAFTAVDPKDGDEGVVAFISDIGPVPMIGADEERVRSLRPMAVQIANARGIEIKLVKFAMVEVIETIGPLQRKEAS